MNILLFLLFLVIGCSESLTQNINGTLNFRPLTSEQIFLFEKVGNRLFVVDSSLIDREGSFQFSSGLYPRGYYQLAINDTNKVDIILNPLEPTVQLEFSEPRLHYGIKVIASSENKVLWDYKFISKSTQEDLKEIQTQLNDPLNSQISIDRLIQRRDSLIKDKKSQLDQLTTAYPNSFFTKVVRASLVPKIKDANELKSRYFENLDFSDAELIRSSIFPGYIMGYLKNHTDLSEPGFAASIDTILNLASANAEVHAFCLEFLLEVFDQLGPPNVFRYIVERHLIADGCSQVNLTELMNGKAEAYVRLMPGKIAPDISVPDNTGKGIRMSRVVGDGKTNLLFFWSSHCTYCKEDLPALKDVYKKYKNGGLQIIAVSLDENNTEWLQSIDEHKLDWIHFSELKGWESAIAKLYKIDRTPSYFLLNADMKILAKPRSVEDLAKNLADLK